MALIKRTFLITGATKGIGRAVSARLAGDGHQVVGIARGEDATFPGTLVRLDLNDYRTSARSLVELALRYDFDGVVNNAGLSRLHHLGEIEADHVEEILSVNLHSAINTVQAILPSMRSKGWGRIVNLSTMAVLGMPRRSAYAAAKAAVDSFTRTWALELAETGITVNSVAPGPVETEMFRRNTPVGSEAERRFLGELPMRRFGRPNEIAAVIAFLLSEESSYITGQILYADGGGSLGKAPM